jgi:hypothetical protein
VQFSNEASIFAQALVTAIDRVTNDSVHVSQRKEVDNYVGEEQAGVPADVSGGKKETDKNGRPVP